jgi:hypothetical protein
MNLAPLAASMDKMTIEDLRALNRLTVSKINERNEQSARVSMAKFYVGDLVDFTNSRDGGVVRLRVERLNTKTLTGKELDGARRGWRVSPGLCRLVGA